MCVNMCARRSGHACNLVARAKRCHMDSHAACDARGAEGPYPPRDSAADDPRPPRGGEAGGRVRHALPHPHRDRACHGRGCAYHHLVPALPLEPNAAAIVLLACMVVPRSTEVCCVLARWLSHPPPGVRSIPAGSCTSAWWGRSGTPRRTLGSSCGSCWTPCCTSIAGCVRGWGRP